MGSGIGGLLKYWKLLVTCALQSFDHPPHDTCSWKQIINLIIALVTKKIQHTRTEPTPWAHKPRLHTRTEPTYNDNL